MGFLGGDNDNSSQDEATQIADQQLKANQAELEAKKESLYQTRLDIIKGQGGENWTPNYGQQAPLMGGQGATPQDVIGKSVKGLFNKVINKAASR